ncbi:hypothetical protein DPM19_01415 [Actinomadura craniellae]|uniref:Uncharacterized protein n=1 Tax=Actinomadura craniellae TaxID=2231787 RepID=A0A365HFC9_9ACTN|nr:hypothetical protein [Actinomadura craniellae]RAY16853.1 hypothetical protein DPM19_01415 [Actinomadura craniellae]
MILGPSPCNACTGTTSSHDPQCPWIADQTPPQRSSGGCGCILLSIAAAVALLGAIGTAAKNFLTGQPIRADVAITMEELPGVWQGDYLCQGVQRAMTLTVRRGAGGSTRVTADFAFYRGQYLSGQPLGISRQQGRYTDGTLTLRPVSWKKRATGFRMVGLDAKPVRERHLVMRGHVQDCGRFTVLKRRATGQ